MSTDISQIIDDAYAYRQALAEVERLRAEVTTLKQSQQQDGQPSQLTRTDLQTMTPDQINTARAEGRLNALMGATATEGA